VEFHLPTGYGWVRSKQQNATCHQQSKILISTGGNFWGGFVKPTSHELKLALKNSKITVKNSAFKEVRT
jgi:hypothetical protein